jgi:putative phosphoribosyl transferase
MPHVLAKALTGEIDRAVAGLDTMCDGVPQLIDDTPTARMLPFANRFAAGHLLGRALAHHRDAIVLGIAREGVVVADGVADELGLPVDVWVARKLALPMQPQLVIGAISEGAGVVLDHEAVERAELTRNQLRALARDAAEELTGDARRFRHGRHSIGLRERTAIIVDDGVRTGGTFAAAVAGVRRRGAAKIILAAPVGMGPTIEALRGLVDEVVCLATPARVRRIAAWYTDFRRVPEATLVRILDQRASQNGGAGRAIA